MNAEKRILIAIDDSDASMRAVRYVTQYLGKQEGIHMYLFHILHPVPPEFLEFIGSENPQEKERMEAKLRQAKAEWLRKEEQAEGSVFSKARAILHEAGVPDQRVQTEFCPSVNQQEVAVDILDAAKSTRCNTLVVGRESFSGLQRLFHHHVADELVREGQGFTIWIVE
jgi:nucleotide-binding universal stress UspA family protein